MKKVLELTPIVNKRNKQISICFKKKELPKKLVKNILDTHKLKMVLYGWE